MSTPDWKTIKEVIENGDVQTMRAWLESGVMAATDQDGLSQPLINKSAECNANAITQLLVWYGADVNQHDKNSVLCLSKAIAKNAYSSVAQLLSYGADTEQRSGNFRSGNALHEATFRFCHSGHEGSPIIDRLVLAGANLFAKNGQGRMPVDTARGGEGDSTDERLQAYMDFATRLEEHPETITKEALFGAEGLAQLPGIWCHTPAILAALEAGGESLTHDDVLKPVAVSGIERRESPAVWMVAAGVLDAVNQHLDDHDQAPIGFSDWVGPDKKSTPLLESLCREWGIAAFARSESMEDMHHHQLLSLYQALPEIHRSEIKNFHQLLVIATRNDRSQERAEASGVG